MSGENHVGNKSPDICSGNDQRGFLCSRPMKPRAMKGYEAQGSCFESREGRTPKCPKADKAITEWISRIAFNLLLSMEASGWRLITFRLDCQSHGKAPQSGSARDNDRNDWQVGLVVVCLSTVLLLKNNTMDRNMIDDVRSKLRSSVGSM
jgi:hypothetical protein